MATYPIPARVESENLEHRATTIDQHEPLPTRGLFTQGPAHSGRQSIERTPHVGGLGAQPDSTPRETVQHDPARRSRSTTPGPSSSSTSHAPGPDEVGDIRVCAGLVSSTNSASGWSSSTAAGVARSLRRHRSNGLSANRCAAQNLPWLRPARSNRSTSSRHCAAVRHARCLVPPARLMSPLASVSWGAASESDGTPDQNKASFGRLPRSSPSPRSRFLRFAGAGLVQTTDAHRLGNRVSNLRPIEVVDRPTRPPAGFPSAARLCTRSKKMRLYSSAGIVCVVLPTRR